MTLHQAASFLCPAGRHRHRPLAGVALDDPDYLLAIVSGKYDGECPPGSAFREAVEVVARKVRENLESDAAMGLKQVEAGEYARSVAELSARNRDVVAARDAAEARKGRDRRAGAFLGGPEGDLFTTTESGARIMIVKVISGGQSGADLAGLEAARAAGIATGGWAPRGWWSEVWAKGEEPRFVPRRELLEPYGLVESPEPESAGLIAECFRVRTRLNVRDSDGTISFSRDTSPGYKATAAACKALGKPLLRMRPGTLNEGRIRQAADWCAEHGVRVLNVAGHRESSMPGIGGWVATFLIAMFERTNAAGDATTTTTATAATPGGLF